jgi:hypothetical protein
MYTKIEKMYFALPSGDGNIDPRLLPALLFLPCPAKKIRALPQSAPFVLSVVRVQGRVVR